MKTHLPALLAVGLFLAASISGVSVAVGAEPLPGAVAPAVSSPTLSGLPGSSEPDTSTAPAVAPAPNVAPPPAAEPNYKIVADDVLRLDVWGEPQLSNMQLAVTPGGTISIPYLGETNVQGMTQGEVAQFIAKKLAEAEIVADAKVQVTLITIHRPQVRLLGAVQRPGSFEFKTGDTVLDAIAQGGSYSDDAMLESATLTHKGSSESIPVNLKKMLAGDLSQNTPLENGDAIYIPHEEYKNKIYVMGQVLRPGQYSLKERTTILSAINLAGGPTERGSIRSTLIIRGNAGKPEKVKCNLKALFDKGDLSQDLALEAGDVVLIPETKTPNWGNIAQIFSTLTNIRYLTKWGLF